MKSVGTTLADERDLPSLRPRKRCIRIRDADLELVDTLHSRRYEVCCVCAASNRVVRNIDAIHRNRILIAAGAGDRASVIAKSSVGGCIVRRGTGLQRKKLRGIALQGGKTNEGFPAHNGADLRI